MISNQVQALHHICCCYYLHRVYLIVMESSSAASSSSLTKVVAAKAKEGTGLLGRWASRLNFMCLGVLKLCKDSDDSRADLAKMPLDDHKTVL